MKSEGFFRLLQGETHVVPENPIIVKDFKISVLAAYSHDKEQLQKDMSFVATRHIMPMPMQVSPLYVLLRGQGIPTERYVNSIDMMLWMRQIYMAFCKNPYMDHFKKRAKQIIKLTDDLDKMVADCEDVLIRQLGILVQNFATVQEDEQQTLQKMCMLLARYTIDIINFMEIAIMGALQIKCPLTPQVDSILDMNQVFNDSQKKHFIEFMCTFFDWKNTIMNAMLPEESRRIFFNVADFPRRIRETPPEHVFCGFIDRATLREYLDYLDFDDVL